MPPLEGGDGGSNPPGTFAVRATSFGTPSPTVHWIWAPGSDPGDLGSTPSGTIRGRGSTRASSAAEIPSTRAGGGSHGPPTARNETGIPVADEPGGIASSRSEARAADRAARLAGEMIPEWPEWCSGRSFDLVTVETGVRLSLPALLTDALGLGCSSRAFDPRSRRYARCWRHRVRRRKARLRRQRRYSAPRSRSSDDGRLGYDHGQFERESPRGG